MRRGPNRVQPVIFVPVAMFSLAQALNFAETASAEPRRYLKRPARQLACLFSQLAPEYDVSQLTAARKVRGQHDLLSVTVLRSISSKQTDKVTYEYQGNESDLANNPLRKIQIEREFREVKNTPWFSQTYDVPKVPSIVSAAALLSRKTEYSIGGETLAAMRKKRLGRGQLKRWIRMAQGDRALPKALQPIGKILLREGESLVVEPLELGVRVTIDGVGSRERRFEFGADELGEIENLDIRTKKPR